MQAIELRRCAVTAAPAPDLVYMHEHTQAPDHGPDDWPTARLRAIRQPLASMSDPDMQYAPPPVRGTGPFGLPVRRAAPGPCHHQDRPVLRENLSGKNGNRLTMTWRVTSGIGVEHFSSGDHAGEKRRASCGALPHPPVWEETTSPSRSATKTLRAGLAQAIPARQKPKQSRSKPRPPRPPPWLT